MYVQQKWGVENSHLKQCPRTFPQPGRYAIEQLRGWFGNWNLIVSFIENKGIKLDCMYGLELKVRPVEYTNHFFVPCFMSKLFQTGTVIDCTRNRQTETLDLTDSCIWSPPYDSWSGKDSVYPFSAIPSDRSDLILSLSSAPVPC